ncbi:hypothetical protein EFE42_05650 [Methanohalophilus sp. RSK]|uniref:hypothetical protein n=1 Tax=Methanohalophilus sp. RSK TaxID=2485783 RepID=UPI000F439A80|nr:hypothetical protein [Methanohalophilus sp. RSK]RNI14095.1 hypothetical protein EFE42_05650 [Methanohalophilus sp. RSK]
MSLPEICPLDGTQVCKKRKCHLYHVDWRTGDENCSVGYNQTTKMRKSSESVVDEYAQRVKEKLKNRTEPPVDSREPTEEIPHPKGDKAPTKEKTSEISTEGKRKSIDKAMELDLPDDYEEEFWSDR